MRLFTVVSLTVFFVVGCASHERQIPAGATVIYDSATKGGPDVFSICDNKGNLVYLTKEKNGPIYAIKEGCLPTPPEVKAPKEAVVAPVAAPASAVVTPAPGREPILIQIVPAPGTDVQVAPAPTKSAPKPQGIKPCTTPCK